MGNVTWTKWSRFDQIVVDFSDPTTPDSTTVYGWENAVAYSLGLSYYVSDSVTLKFGGGFDESPVANAQLRHPSIPDADRTRAAIGLNWKLSDQSTFDLAYTHLFLASAPINNTDDQTHNLLGSFDSSADVISAQFSWNF